MNNTSIYNDIAKRTGGDIFIGVVGPVRSGKSTFIKKFIEAVVLPNIESEYDRTRTRDELPQSAGGKAVMTTEPKFVPDEGVNIALANGAKMKVKMIDCVGYMIPEAVSKTENGESRMVHTPWSDEPMPFEAAAEMGTAKVINEHSTIGMLVTSDGTVGEIARESYVAAEERIARELKAIGKPFAVILNSAAPDSPDSEVLAMSLEAKYGVPVALVNCLELDAQDVDHIIGMLLGEFPIREISVELPPWAGALDRDHKLIRRVYEAVSAASEVTSKMGDVQNGFMTVLGEKLADMTDEGSRLVSVAEGSFDMGNGEFKVKLSLPHEIYYGIIGEITDEHVESERDVLKLLTALSDAKHEFDKFEDAIAEVNAKGYGIVMPDISDMTLEEPVIVKQAGNYGVKLRASAPSIHMIKADIETELNPIVGTEQQSEELVKSMLKEFEEDPSRLWESNMFGKSLYDLVNEGLHAKLEHMPDDARAKLSDTLAQIINEGSGGLICIIL